MNAERIERLIADIEAGNNAAATVPAQAWLFALLRNRQDVLEDLVREFADRDAATRVRAALDRYLQAALDVMRLANTKFEPTGCRHMWGPGTSQEAGAPHGEEAIGRDGAATTARGANAFGGQDAGAGRPGGGPGATDRVDMEGGPR